MRKIKLLLGLAFFFISCVDNKRNEEFESQKRTIEQQEQRLKKLEDRLDNIDRGNSQSSKRRQTSLPNNTPNRNTFYIGASEADVIEIQGTPTSIHSVANMKIYSFGSSSVTFEDGKVTSYSNYGNNLKINLTKSQLKRSHNKALPQFGRTVIFSGSFRYQSFVIGLTEY